MDTATGTRILLVEEDQSTRNIVSQILTEDGHEVTQVSEPQEALRVYQKAPFPVVITEIAMRSMSGIDLLKKIKELCPDTEVIILTSYASIDTAVAALRSGAYEYLIKPIEGVRLISAVVNRTIEKIRLVTENRLLLQRLKQENAELKSLNQKLQRFNVLDESTGLYKAAHFQEALEAELIRSQENDRTFSLILLEVTIGPMPVAEKPGSTVAGKLTKTFADCLKANLRRSDLISRHGDSGFAIILPETPKEGALYVARKLGELLLIECPGCEPDTENVALQVHYGVANYPEDGQSSSEMVRQTCQGMNLLASGE